MPAPLARGLILSLSLLFAAGLAVYENPQVKQWVEDHRRKIAVTLQGWGSEIGSPSQPQPQRQAARGFDDASTKEDMSPEAVERRRRATEELLERRRILTEKSGSSTPLHRRGSSFDDMVDSEGNLKGNATGVFPGSNNEGLRRRQAGAAGAAMGAAFGNPFADEMSMEPEHRGISDEDLARELQAQFDREELEARHGPISPIDEPLSQEELAQFQSLLERETGRSGAKEVREGTHGISEVELLRHLQELQGNFNIEDESGRRTPTAETASTAPSTHTFPRALVAEAEGVLIEMSDAASTHPSEALVDLTPTTSAPGTPRQAPRQPAQQQSYQSIQDWADQSMAAASFHSIASSTSSQHGSFEHLTPRPDDDIASVSALSEHASDVDMVSDPGISTPGTWTEVGSETHSNDGHHH